jgi:uncharacterized protein YbjQ (UPF0145 family)
MPPWWQFWRGPTEEEKRSEELQQQSILALESGDIPVIAKERIRLELAKGAKFFSSDLTVREFLLTKEAGIEPVAQVMGTAFYNVSFWGSYMGPMRSTGELEKITHAQTEARKLALNRMKVEAKLLGASGVIGVRLQVKETAYAQRMTEFTAYGTAVRIPNYPPEAEPFTSDLNGQDFWQLYKAGYRPKGVVMGLCSYYLNTNWRSFVQQFGILGLGGFKNQEIEQYTNGFYEARSRAINRFTQEMYELQADGAVGMNITHSIDEIRYGDNSSSQVDILINFTAMGTAVDSVAKFERTSPLWCIDLRRGGDKSLQVEFNEGLGDVQYEGDNGIDDDE